MNVLIIPEDFRKDQYLLKPLFTQLFADLGRPRAKVVVCNNPLLGGISETLKIDRLRAIVNMYRMVDLFLLCVDRDGELGRRRRLDQIEADFSPSNLLLAENAWEELETWTLAGLDLPSSWNWKKVREDVSVKENYFDVYARSVGVHDGPGGGRRALGEQSAKHIDAILLKCPEDFAVLAKRIQLTLSSS